MRIVGTGVSYKNGLVGTMKRSVDINKNKYKFEEKENQNELITIQKHIETVESEKAIMENQTCAMATEATDERICLIGSMAMDEKIVSAARSFNVPVIVSETGIELVKETQWTTYFVMSEFEGEHFNVIRRSKHRIYGPTALLQIAQSGKGLVYVNRPLYSFSMKGVVTCFTGIRKKDELTRLVNLIHTMGGSIRKDIKDNHRCTHLICNASVGDKYHYAKTFNLTVVRPAWIHAAWEQRDNPNFFANESGFSDAYKLKSFEGLRICFYGFSPEDHQEMVDILKANGGIATDIDDPDCTHLILASNITHLPELMAGPASPPHIPPLVPNIPSTMLDPVSEEKIQPPEGLDQLNLNENVNDKIVHTKLNSSIVVIDENVQPIFETPKKSFKINNMPTDGIILPGGQENHFLEPANLSPILHNIEEEEENESQSNDDKEMSKRKRDSFDNISIISTDTFAAQFSSAKKPKLIRTGSITRSLRRSMSFAALKNPITNMIRVRRNSIDPNASINSVTSMESTFSDIKRPVKDKLLSLKHRITNSNRSKRDVRLTPKTPKRMDSSNAEQSENDNDKFVLPNDTHILSCQKLVNSTMNGKTLAESSELSAPENSNVTRSREGKQVTGADVADNSSAICAQPQSLSLASTENQHDHQKNSVPFIVKSDWFW